MIWVEHSGGSPLLLYRNEEVVWLLFSLEMGEWFILKSQRHSDRFLKLHTSMRRQAYEVLKQKNAPSDTAVKTKMPYMFRQGKHWFPWNKCVFNFKCFRRARVEGNLSPLHFWQKLQISRKVERMMKLTPMHPSPIFTDCYHLKIVDIVTLLQHASLENNDISPT